MTTQARVPPSSSPAVSQLVRLLPRMVRWQAAVCAAIVVGVVVWWQNDLLESAEGSVWLLRIAGAVMVLGAVFTLDDASRRMTEPAVVPRRVQTGVRLGLAGLVVLVGCALPAWLAHSVLLSDDATVGTGVEVAALAMAAAAFALTLQHGYGVDEPAQFVALGLVGLLLAVQAMGVRWPMLVSPGPEWSAAHLRWLALLLLASGVVAWHLRDPASPPLWTTLRRWRAAE